MAEYEVMKFPISTIACFFLDYDESIGQGPKLENLIGLPTYAFTDIFDLNELICYLNPNCRDTRELMQFRHMRHQTPKNNIKEEKLYMKQMMKFKDLLLNHWKAMLNELQDRNSILIQYFQAILPSLNKFMVARKANGKEPARVTKKFGEKMITIEWSGNEEKVNQKEVLGRICNDLYLDDMMFSVYKGKPIDFIYSDDPMSIKSQSLLELKSILYKLSV